MPYIKVETLSPIHIGSGTEFMGNYEYLKFSNERKVVVIDERKVLNLIGLENLDRWVSLIENQGDLLDYLQTQKSDLAASDVARFSMHLPGVTPKKENSIKAFIRNGQNYPYVPGSSLKGAMRTAFLRMLIDQQPDFVDKLNNLQNYKGDFKDQKLVKNYLVNTNEKGKEPNHDVFRFLQITDATFYETHCLKAQTLNEKQEEKFEVKNQVSQFVEALPAGALGVARLTIPKKQVQEYHLRHKLPGRLKENLEEHKLFKIINAHTMRLLEDEIKSWEDFNMPRGCDDFVSELKRLKNITRESTENSCVMRMGYGSGFYL